MFRDILSTLKQFENASLRKMIIRLIPLSIEISILLSCSISGYITDPASIQRQKKMHQYRTGVNIGESFLVVGAAVGAAFTGVDLYSQPQGQAYRKLKLQNDSKDTLFVNMVTDYRWKDSAYFDIRDIVMPPVKSMKLIVPMGVSYNIYFRNEYGAPDDEKVEINTSEVRKVRLKPDKERSGTKTIN